MTLPIDSLQRVRLVADANTPALSLPYADLIVLLHAEDMIQLGSGPTNPGILLGLWGYPTGVVDGVTQYLMTNALDDVTRDFIRDIPGPLGWKDTNQRQVYRQAARQMIRDLGVPAPETRIILQTLFDAAKTETLTP